MTVADFRRSLDLARWTIRFGLSLVEDDQRDDAMRPGAALTHAPPGRTGTGTRRAGLER
jgi:hypothetical protein